MARKKLLTEGEVRQFMKLASLGGLTETYLSNNPLEERDEEEELEAELHATEDELGAEDELADDEGDELDAEMDLGGEDNEELLARVVQAVANELGVEVDVEGAGEEGGEDLEADVDMDLELDGDDLELELGADEELPGGRDMYEEGEGSKKGEYKRRDKDGKVGRRAGDVDHHYKDYEDDTGEKKGDESSTHPGRKDYLEEAEPAQQADAEVDDDDAEELARARARHQAAKERQRERRRAMRGPSIAGVTSEGDELDQDAIVNEVARRVAERLSADKQREELASQLAERIFDRLTAK